MTEATLIIKVNSTEVDKATKSLDGLADASGKTEQGSEKLAKSTENLAGAARMAIGAFTGLAASYGLREIIAASDAWRSAENSLRLVTNGAADLANTQKILMSVSNETNSSFESTANLYSRLSRATDAMGLSQSELVGITTTINQSFAVSGATATEAAAAITQLSQGLAAGALRGDEFNSVAEQSPGIMMAIAKSLNMTTGELRSFAGEGGVTADIVVTALQQASESIAEDFGKSLMTFGQASQVAKNNALQFIGTSNLVSSSTEAAGKALIFASEHMEEFGLAAQVVGAVMVGRMIPALASFVASGAAATAATGALTAAMTLLTGPIGVAILAATALYAVADALIAVDKESIRLAGSGFAKQEMEVASLTYEQATSNISETRDSMSRLRSELVSAKEIFGDNSDEVAKLNGQLDLQQNFLNLNKLRVGELSRVIATSSTPAVAQFTDKTLRMIDGLQNQMTALTMTEREQALYNAELKALANGDGPEAIATVRRLTAELYDATEAEETARDELKLFNDSLEDFVKAQKKATDELERNRAAIEDTIEGLENENIALGMTGRSQAVFNAVTEAYNNKAAPEQIAKIAELTAKNYDLANATDLTGSSAEAAAKQSTESWNRTHEYLTTAFIDISDNGGSAFQKIADSAIESVKRIIAEWLAMKAMVMLGIPGGSISGGGVGGGGGGISGAASSAVSSGIGGAARSVIGSIMGGGSAAAATAAPGGVAATMGTGAGIGSTIAAGASAIGSTIAGGASAAGTAIASGASNLVALAAANPVTAAIIAAAALAAALSKEETPSANAGFLIRDLAGGGDGRTFDVPAFDSGFDPVGFARREDQGSAVAVIDSFRAYDSVLTQLAEGAGLKVDYNSNNFGGFNEKGQGGGLFFGAANEDGKNTSVSIADQQEQFVKQWITGLTGQVDQSLINDVLAAGSADEMVKRASAIAGIPAFAYGGYHSGGLMMVGENGPELVNTGPARVLNNSDTMQALKGNSDTILNQVLAELSQIRKYIATSVNIIDQWDGEGLPAVRT